MSPSKPVNCRYYFADFHRGRDTEECRLIKRNPDSRPWRRALCDSCPVPGILIASNSRELALEAKVERKFLREQVEVTFAVCTKHMLELTDPLVCPQCAAEADRSDV